MRGGSWLGRRRGKSPTFGVRLLRLLLGVVVPLLGFVGYLVYEYSQERMRMMEDDVLRETITLAREIDEEVGAVVRQLEAIRAFFNADDGLERLHALAQRTVAIPDVNLVVFDDRGNQLLNAAVSWGTPLRPSAEPNAIAEVARGNAPRVSQAMSGSNRDQLLVTVRMPWQRGAERNVLGMSLTAEHIRRTATTAVNRPESWRWAVTDANGVFIARYPEHDRYVGTRLPDDIIRASSEPVGVRWMTSVDGTEIVRGWSRTRQTDWLVSVAVPTRIVLAPLREAWAWFAVGAMTVFAAAIALALWQSRSLQSYVATLNEDARALGRGQSLEPRNLGVAEFQVVHDELAAAAREIARSRARSELLLRELQHRSRNLLTIALSIVQRTLRGEPAAEPVRSALTGRLHALAAATEALSDADWEGATIATVVRRVMEPFGSQYRMEGEDLLLSAQWATNLALALHELSTNAAKYGALSVPGGRVAVGWSTAGGTLDFTWQETGGPRLQPPSRVGFGTRLLMSLGHDPEMAPVIEHHPDGFRYRLAVPCDVAVAEKHRPDDFSPGRSSPA